MRPAPQREQAAVSSDGRPSPLGGYMIAAPARAIVADPGTLTARSACLGAKIVTRGCGTWPAFTGTRQAGANPHRQRQTRPSRPPAGNISRPASTTRLCRFPEARREAASSPPTPRAPYARPDLDRRRRSRRGLVRRLAGASTASASPATPPACRSTPAVSHSSSSRAGRAAQPALRHRPPGQRREGSGLGRRYPACRTGRRHRRASRWRRWRHRPRCACRRCATTLTARPAQVSGAFLLVEIGEILDLDCVIGNRATISQLAAHRLDEAAERADIHIRPLLDLGDDPCLIWRVCPISSCTAFKARRTSARSISSPRRCASAAAVACASGDMRREARERTPTGHRLSPSPIPPDARHKACRYRMIRS